MNVIFVKKVMKKKISNIINFQKDCENADCYCQ